jgi:hypothetical protein
MQKALVIGNERDKSNKKEVRLWLGKLLIVDLEVILGMVR